MGRKWKAPVTTKPSTNMDEVRQMKDKLLNSLFKLIKSPRKNELWFIQAVLMGNWFHVQPFIPWSVICLDSLFVTCWLESGGYCWFRWTRLVWGFLCGVTSVFSGYPDGLTNLRLCEGRDRIEEGKIFEQQSGFCGYGGKKSSALKYLFQCVQNTCIPQWPSQRPSSLQQWRGNRCTMPISNCTRAAIWLWRY